MRFSSSRKHSHPSRHHINRIAVSILGPLTLAATQSDGIVSAARPQANRGVFLPLLTIAALASLDLENVAWAAEQSQADAAIAGRIGALIPDIEAYIARGMKSFDVPGVAIGIVADDRLVYAQGFVMQKRLNSGR